MKKDITYTWLHGTEKDLKLALVQLKQLGWTIENDVDGNPVISGGQKLGFHVQLVEDCSPKGYSFDNKKDFTKFVDAFNKKHPNSDESWIDLVCYGKLLFMEKSLTLHNKKKKQKR